MILSITCKSCGAAITGDTDDELVENVQAHASNHGHSRPLTRNHVLHRLAHEKDQHPHAKE